MKTSGYRSTLHVYFVLFLTLISVAGFAILYSLAMINVPTTDGSSVKSNYPKELTEHFDEQIMFIDDIPQLKQSGRELLLANHAGIQILNEDGQEIVSYQKSENLKDAYSFADLLELNQSGRIDDSKTTAFLGTVTHNEKDYTYIIQFPLRITKVTMYLNQDRFTTGKTMILLCVCVTLLIIMFSGFIYGFWLTKMIARISLSVKEIANRSYIKVTNNGVFRDIFRSLNLLDTEIKLVDKTRDQTEAMRKEWIANITHDLKTPLSPIKGYGELLSENISTPEEQKKYAQVILKNTCYMESLIDDLKLTYQLDSGIIPFEMSDQNIVRCLKELVIDVLNYPAYENRTIHFDCPTEDITLSFNHKLMTRAFQNLIINAFTHGNNETEVSIQISKWNNTVQIILSDNGPGMTQEEVNQLFQRYYRGTNTEKNTAGTGLGLAITKSIIQAQGGSITVASKMEIGTDFKIIFPL